MKVRDVMTSDPIVVPPETPLRDVARILAERRISGLPVCEGDRCIGIVSEEDLLPKQAGRVLTGHSLLGMILGESEAPEAWRRRSATTARQAMSAPPITIGLDASVREAAALMVRRDVNRLPVVDGDRLVGIVTRADLVRAYLSLDEEIDRTIREEVLRRTMWLDPGEFKIDVREGAVTIAGRVDRRSTATIIEKLIGLVDGVSQVHSRLEWELDDRTLPPAADVDREPAAASITAREHPQPLHR